MINFYLSPENAVHADRIRVLARAPETPDGLEALTGFVREALSKYDILLYIILAKGYLSAPGLDPVIPAVYRYALQQDELVDGDVHLSFTAHDSLFFSLRSIGMDVSVKRSSLLFFVSYILSRYIAKNLP